MALSLTRKLNESIQIGADCMVTVQEIRGGRVILAVEAPRDVRIQRIPRPTVADETAREDLGSAATTAPVQDAV